jgi:hypothetical protein
MQKSGIGSFSVRKIVAGLVLSLCISLTQASVVIQEVLYDGPGTDPDDVFTELSGMPGTVLDGWSLVGINGSNGEAYRVIDLGGLIIAEDGLFVIATSSASSVLALRRDYIANVDWQNGPDALHLLYGTAVIDALQYGDAGVYNAGEGGFAEDVSGTLSLSRDLLGTDTDNNGLDFRSGSPSPGSGLSVVPIPAAAWLFASGLGLLAVLRRRVGGVLSVSPQYT